MIQIEKKRTLKKTACLSCGEPQEYTVTAKNGMELGEMHFCQKCLRELAAKATRASCLYASEEKTSFALKAPATVAIH